MSAPKLPPPIKRLGQHFLIDANIVRKIVAVAELEPVDHVLEIGPGRGILTEALCRAAGRVTAVEVDSRLHAYLESRRAELPNVELVCEDALSYPVESLPVGTVVVANLPYYISTPLLFKLLDQRGRFPRMVLMLQEEVADRLVAKPGGSDYGVLSVMAQYAAEITKSFRVSARCFRPSPDIASAVMLLRTNERTRLNPGEEVVLRRLVKAAFAHRRKTLTNSLRDEGYELPSITGTLQRLDIAPTRRAETLSVEEFILLAHAIG
ncbi:MAG TPA: 16S rRNA (adenine(1518)-N(6)/adenine(1519)-N(6))-dimethyltransferase RsmA [Nitrospiraceae bacterium]|nr:16S rRNA (adenine(1518)-N(6)/adenine(1519)-N(6))-dimethyltransferase RsmA [Nitrospiraceae bacterium]